LYVRSNDANADHGTDDLELCDPLTKAKSCSIIKNSGRAVDKLFMCLQCVCYCQTASNSTFLLILKMDTPDAVQVLIQKHGPNLIIPTENFILSVV